jgi:hypothetical protein
VAAGDAIQKSKNLQDLHRKYLERVQSARSSALLAKIVNCLFDIPAMTISITMRELDISYNSTKNNIQKLIDLKILKIGPDSHPQWYYAEEIMRIGSE